MELVGLQNASVRSRLVFLREALAVVKNPAAYSDDPISYGRAYQRIFDAFSIWGWEKTGGDQNITHNLGRVQKENLARLYEEWSRQKEKP